MSRQRRRSTNWLVTSTRKTRRSHRRSARLRAGGNRSCLTTPKTPSWTRILKDLAAQHELQATRDELLATARKEWQTEDVAEFRSFVEQLRADRGTSHPSVKALIQQLTKSSDASSLIQNLVGINAQFSELDTILRSILAEHDQFDFPQLGDVLASLREQTGLLVELSPLHNKKAQLPEQFTIALRRVDVSLNEFEAVIGHKSLNQVYRQD